MGKGAIKRMLMALGAGILLTSYVAYANESITLEKANQAFRDGKYEEARANYLQLISRGVVAPELFFNLGNIWLKQGEPGRAILNFRRSLVLNPHFAGAQQHLDSALGAIGSNEEHSLYRWLAFRSDLLFALTVAFFWLTTIAILLCATSQRLRSPGKISLLVVAPLFALSFGLAIWVGDGMKDPNLAVVVDQSADIRYGPAASARTVITAGAGQELRLIAERGEWTLCRLENGLRGWIHTRSVEHIIPK
jgi:tetratricopeptide (TPR) repeat protein